MSERAKAITTLVVALLTLFNAIAPQFGWNPLNLDETTIYTAVSAVIAVVVAVYTWWKNNNVTDAAAEAQKYLDELKAGDKE